MRIGFQRQPKFLGMRTGPGTGPSVRSDATNVLQGPVRCFCLLFSEPYEAVPSITIPMVRALFRNRLRDSSANERLILRVAMNANQGKGCCCAEDASMGASQDNKLVLKSFLILPGILVYDGVWEGNSTRFTCS